MQYKYTRKVNPVVDVSDQDCVTQFMLGIVELLSLIKNDAIHLKGIYDAA